MTSTGLDSLLSSVVGGGSRSKSDTPTTLSLEHCIAALKDKAHRMMAPCPFQIGQLVTARADADVKGSGRPHVVVEVFDTPVTDPTAESGSNQFMRKYNMRVAHYVGNDMTVHAVDCSCFEAWTDAHADAFVAKQEAQHKKLGTRQVAATTPLSEIVRVLRGESRKLLDAKITWKKGDLVEIQGFETSNAAKPMLFEGKAIGAVETVDKSDDTTKVTYFDDDGDRRSQWFKPIDLKPYAPLEPVEN
jgi:hypothetical protein